MDKPKCWVKNAIKKIQIDPNLGSNNPALFRVYECKRFQFVLREHAGQRLHTLCQSKSNYLCIWLESDL